MSVALALQHIHGGEYATAATNLINAALAMPTCADALHALAAARSALQHGQRLAALTALGHARACITRQDPASNYRTATLHAIEGARALCDGVSDR